MEYSLHRTDVLGARLRAGAQTVAVAESSAGGLVSAALLAVPGASAWYAGGGVFYTARSRRVLLGARAEDVAGIAPLSAAMASHFAELVRSRLDSTWGVAELGVAGPTGARYGQAPGVCAIAVAGPVSRALVFETGSAEREANMYRFASSALELLEEVVTEAALRA